MSTVHRVQPTAFKFQAKSHLDLQNFPSAPCAEISLALSPLYSFLRFHSFRFCFKFYIRVNLQCHVSYRCTTKWFSYTYTCIYSFSNYFPIQVVTEFWAEFPVLYCKSLFCFTLYVVVCLCQSQTPSLSLPPLLFPLGKYKILWLWICFCFVNKYICVIFFFRFHT